MPSQNLLVANGVDVRVVEFAKRMVDEHQALLTEAQRVSSIPGLLSVTACCTRCAGVQRAADRACGQHAEPDRHRHHERHETGATVGLSVAFPCRSSTNCDAEPVDDDAWQAARPGVHAGAGAAPSLLSARSSLRLLC